MLVSEELTQTAGADTPKHDDDRYSGTVTVDVKKANHRAPKCEQTYTLDNDRAKFYDADHNHVAGEPMPGERVKVKGRITQLPRKCDARRTHARRAREGKGEDHPAAEEVRRIWVHGGDRRK